MKLNKKEQAVFEKRNTRYRIGFVNAHENLGLIWTGLIQSYYGIKLSEPLPSHLVLTMMSASKLNRAVSEKKMPDEDNYDDGKIYLELAKNAKKETMETESGQKKSRS